MADTLPVFAKMVPGWRPGGIDNHFAAWDCLTHGGLAESEGATGLATMTNMEYHDWKNNDGVTIRASFRGIRDEKVILLLRNGRQHHYPLDQLDKESQALAKRLTR